METARAEDPELDELRRVVAAWADAAKDKPMTASDLVDLALDKQYDGSRSFPAL